MQDIILKDSGKGTLNGIGTMDNSSRHIHGLGLQSYQLNILKSAQQLVPTEYDLSASITGISYSM